MRVSFSSARGAPSAAEAAWLVSSVFSRGNTDGDNGLARAQARNRHVVVARAITDAMTAAVEGQQRRDDDIGENLERIRPRLADAPDSRHQQLTERESAHGEWLPSSGNRGQRQLRACIREPSHQRNGIDLALQRHEAGDDRIRRHGERKRPLGDRLGGGSAHFGR